METPAHAVMSHASEDVLHRFSGFGARAVDGEAHPWVGEALTRGQSIRAHSASSLLSQAADHTRSEPLSNGDTQEC